MKVQNEKAKIIARYYKKWKFRKTIFINLKILVRRIRIWKKIAKKKTLEFYKKGFQEIKIFSTEDKKEK